MKNTIMHRQIAVYVIVVLVMQSCVTSKYSTPEVELTETFRTAEVAVSDDTASIAQQSWREIFTDPLLIGYIETALEKNNDMRFAFKQIEIAELYYFQGKAQFYPTLSAEAGHTYQKSSENTAMGSFNSSGQNITAITGYLSWEADIWGKLRSNKRALEAGVLQSQANRQAMQTRLVAGVASMYYDLLTIDEQIKITKETIEAREESLEVIKVLKQSGRSNELAVKQTEAQVLAAKSILVDLKNQIRTLENSMSVLLGVMPQNIKRSSFDEQEIDIDLKVGTPLSLLRNRPDVRAAEYALQNAFELTNVAKAQLYPSLTITASGGLQSNDISNLIDAGSLFTSIFGGLAQPIFNGKRLRTQHEVSMVQQEQTKINFEQAILLGCREVSDALFAYEASQENIQLKKEAFEVNTLSVEYAEELLNYGYANYLEVLTAQQNALNAGLTLAVEKNNRLQALVNLYQALGGGAQ
ncbi:MAG: efflux transporter outer membrane subunit [Bacteroidales bacterium]